MLDLLDPVGAVKQSGSQEYGPSGRQLPKVASSMIIRPVQLVPIQKEVGEKSHTALLAARDINDLEDDGYRRITHADGYTHVQTTEEMEQDRDSGIMWNPMQAGVTCSFCLSSMYDDATGLLVRCQDCHDIYHQACHVPILTDGKFDKHYWKCAVCSGDDPDICRVCGKNWTDPLKDNRLLYCEGTCGNLWHQKCHVPPVKYNGAEPWLCATCCIEAADREAELEAQSAGAVKRSGRNKKSKPKGWTQGNAHGVNFGGSGGSNLDKAVWTSTGVNVGKKQKPQKSKKKKK